MDIVSVAARLTVEDKAIANERIEIRRAVSALSLP
jgi:hypothetical protein